MNISHSSFKILILFICLLYLSCNQSQVPKDIPSIFIDIPSKKGSIDSLFSKVELIRLDTANGGILNFISSIDYMNSKFYIKQNSTQEVFCFDSCGRFNLKISDQGNGAQEYNYVSGFRSNPFGNTLVILDHSELHQYDTLGNYIGNIKFDHKGESLDAIVPLNSDKYICISGKLSSNYDLLSVNDKSIISAFSDPVRSINGVPFYILDNQLYHYKWQNNTIYKVKDDASLLPHYTLNFEDGIDVTFPSSISNDDEIEYLMKKKGVCIVEIQESDKYIYMKLIQTGGDNMNWVSLIYDKLRKQSYDLSHFKESINWDGYIYLVEGDYLIGFVNAHNLKNSIDVELLDPASQKIYNQITEYDNPVIVKSKLR